MTIEELLAAHVAWKRRVLAAVESLGAAWRADPADTASLRRLLAVLREAPEAP